MEEPIIKRYIRKKCVICGEVIEGFGHNAQPLGEGLCCDFCNKIVVKERAGGLI